MRRGWSPSSIAAAVYTMQQVPTPSLTPAGGHYDLPQQVTIGCSMPEAAIYYTLNGSEPTTGSTRYSGPVTIAENKTLRARAFRIGWMPSEIATGDYIIGLFYDFETWDGNFFSQSGWQWGAPSQIDSTHSKVRCWAMALSGNYPYNAPYVLLTPSWHLGDGVQFSFWHRYYMAYCTDRWGGVHYDTGDVFLSIDNGATWTKLVSTDGRSGFIGTQNAWSYISYDLSAYANQDVVLKYSTWANTWEYNYPNVGWFIDDVQVTNAAEVKKRGAGR
jgi:hypothetical protein